MRANNEESLDEEEDDEIDHDERASKEEASQSGQKQSGIVHRIYCENFMNHQKLDITFCRNINFIHGT